jgi:hypothetical protein
VPGNFLNPGPLALHLVSSIGITVPSSRLIYFTVKNGFHRFKFHKIISSAVNNLASVLVAFVLKITQ